MADEVKKDALMCVPARVITTLRDVPALRYDANTTLELSNREAMLEVIKSHAPDPTIFDESPPYVWAAEISSDNRDYYHTRMDIETTLKNFVEDSIRGVTFLDSHIQSEKLGRSFASAFVEQENRVSVYSAFYTIPDVRSSMNNTSDLIKRIRAGIEKDVSVGFKRSEGYMARCSACGRDMYRDWDCDHFPGEKARVWDEDLENYRDVVVYVTIVNARLAEVSGVYDGATPDAMIEKALDFAKRGVLKPATVRLLESQYRIILPGKATQISGIGDRQMRQDTSDSDESNTTRKGENIMADEPNKNPLLDEFKRGIVNLKLVEKEDDVSSFREGMRIVSLEVSRLRSIEDERNKFFNEEVADALKEGVRAQGDAFKKEMFESILKRSSLTEVRSFREQWKSEADKVLAPNRRSTEAGDAETQTDDENADGENADASTDANTRSTKKEEVKLDERMIAQDNLIDLPDGCFRG